MNIFNKVYTHCRHRKKRSFIIKKTVLKFNNTTYLSKYRWKFGLKIYSSFSGKTVLVSFTNQIIFSFQNYYNKLKYSF